MSNGCPSPTDLFRTTVRPDGGTHDAPVGASAREAPTAVVYAMGSARRGLPSRPTNPTNRAHSSRPTAK
jgi:hypothetical protein